MLLTDQNKLHDSIIAELSYFGPMPIEMLLEKINSKTIKYLQADLIEALDYLKTVKEIREKNGRYAKN